MHETDLYNILCESINSPHGVCINRFIFILDFSKLMWIIQIHMYQHGFPPLTDAALLFSSQDTVLKFTISETGQGPGGRKRDNLLGPGDVEVQAALVNCYSFKVHMERILASSWEVVWPSRQIPLRYLLR
ncbi:uncharacterized protein LOC104856514 isoform X1 [Fukomys damarensis]|uniref:uncharacterized protein LOC104856514 isoform X1 n=1 Tax=Fukomys damarensis TaxID=885580 RepID=UPI00053FADA8|nr:uncharacterized protein LOC104856514 isoform X1 [Fukomys damarensis]